MCVAYTLQLLLQGIHLQEQGGCSVTLRVTPYTPVQPATRVPEVCSRLQTTQYEGITITSLFCPQPCIFR